MYSQLGTISHSTRTRLGCRCFCLCSPVIPLLAVGSLPLELPLLFSEIHGHLLILGVAVSHCIQNHGKGNALALSPCIQTLRELCTPVFIKHLSYIAFMVSNVLCGQEGENLHFSRQRMRYTTLPIVPKGLNSSRGPGSPMT